MQFRRIRDHRDHPGIAHCTSTRLDARHDDSDYFPRVVTAASRVYICWGLHFNMAVVESTRWPGWPVMIRSAAFLAAVNLVAPRWFIVAMVIQACYGVAWRSFRPTHSNDDVQVPDVNWTGATVILLASLVGAYLVPSGPPGTSAFGWAVIVWFIVFVAAQWVSLVQ